MYRFSIDAVTIILRQIPIKLEISLRPNVTSMYFFYRFHDIPPSIEKKKKLTFSLKYWCS